jgi:carboxyl-terminal processing protease
MKKVIYAQLILLFFTSCSKIFLCDTPENNPISVFDSFYQQVNENYSGKDVRPISWDSLYQVYRPKITAQTTDNQLIDIFKAVVLPYKDLHFNFKTNNNFYSPSLDAVKVNGVPDFISDAALENSLKKQLKTYKNLFAYEKTAGNIGFIVIKTFNSEGYSQADYENFDNILEELKDTKSLILDIRTNSGGSETYAKFVAGRFATTAQVYKYTRTKMGVNKTHYTDFAGSTLQPRGAWQYTKPVVLLTGRYSYSTAINFTMMLRLLPNVNTVGNLTGDGVVGFVSRELPNGWLAQFPSGLAYLPDKTVVEGSGGIKPKVLATISEEQKKNGQDAILEKALDMLK